MRTKASKFNRRVVDGDARVILVGMSNVGKSYRAKELEKNAGFVSVDVDGAIEAQLSEVMVADGVHDVGIKAVADWMGSPHATDPEARTRFEGAQQRYLDLESGVYREVSRRGSGRFNSVIDTTGSFVHTPRDVQNALARTGLVVYIQANEQDYDDMLQSYVERPKPVVWGDTYTEQEGESPTDSIARSYRELLVARHIGYSRVADVTIPKNEAWDLGAGEFLRDIADRLQQDTT